MRSHHPTKAVALIGVCCVLTLTGAIFPAQAAGRSRVLKIALLASGLGLKFGSVFVEKSAQNSYDQYLKTAIQADIAQHRDNYTGKRDTSVIMSRLGIGLAGVATLISIFDQLDLISKRSSPESAAFRFTPNYNFQSRETTLRLKGQF